MQLGDYQKGIQRAEQAVTLAKAQNDTKALIPALLTSAVGRGHTGDYPGAYAAATEAFNLAPRGPYAKGAFAIVQLTKGRPARTSEGLEGAPASQAEEQKLAEVLELASPLNDPRVRLAGQAALNHLKAIAFLNQAMADLKVDDPAKALDAAQKAFDLDPRIPDIHMQRALALMALKKQPDAVRELGEAIKLWTARPNSGKSLAAAYNTRSMLGAELKDFPNAFADAEAALKLDPVSAQGYFNRARAKQATAAKTEEALADFKRASELDPAHFTADYQEALARHKRGPSSAAPAPSARASWFWGLAAFAAGLFLSIIWIWRRRKAEDSSLAA